MLPFSRINARRGACSWEGRSRGLALLTRTRANAYYIVSNMATASLTLVPSSLEIAPLVPSTDAQDVFVFDDTLRQMLATMLMPAQEDETVPTGAPAPSFPVGAPWSELALVDAGSASDGAAVAAALLCHCACCSCRVVQRYTYVSGEGEGARGIRRIDR